MHVVSVAFFIILVLLLKQINKPIFHKSVLHLMCECDSQTTKT